MTQSPYPLRGDLLESRRALARSRPPVFFKYLGLDGLKSVLEGRSIRYCDPRRFNDPFDAQLDYRLGFNMAEFEEAFAEELVRVAFMPEPPELNPSMLMYPFMSTIRSLAAERPDSKVELEQFARSSARRSWPNLERTLKRINDDWRTWLSTMRVFCVAEENDNLLMWAHYAQSHEGGVLALKHLPEFDTALLAAERVKYQEDLPIFMTLENWVRRGTAQQADAVFRDYVVLKSACWSYEKEWRAFAAVESADQPFRYSELWPEELAGIYLGCRMTEAIRGDVIRLARDRFPGAQLFQATRSESRFCLDFHEIK